MQTLNERFEVYWENVVLPSLNNNLLLDSGKLAKIKKVVKESFVFAYDHSTKIISGFMTLNNFSPDSYNLVDMIYTIKGISYDKIKDVKCGDLG